MIDANREMHKVSNSLGHGGWPSGLGLRTGDRVVLSSSPASQLRFGTLAIPFTPHRQCISEETLKAVGPFHLVSMLREVKDPTSPHWKCVTCRGLHQS